MEVEVPDKLTYEIKTCGFGFFPATTNKDMRVDDDDDVGGGGSDDDYGYDNDDNWWITDDEQC